MGILPGVREIVMSGVEARTERMNIVLGSIV